MTDNVTLARVVAESLQYDRLPDFDVYNQTGAVVCDTIERVAPEVDE